VDEDVAAQVVAVSSPAVLSRPNGSSSNAGGPRSAGGPSGARGPSGAGGPSNAGGPNNAGGPSDAGGPNNAAKPHLDLVAAARHQLAGLGVADVRTVAVCTRCEPDLLWSYRRLGRRAGRNHAFIWRRRSPR
jgi:hypothetical protein